MLGLEFFTVPVRISFMVSVRVIVSFLDSVGFRVMVMIMVRDRISARFPVRVWVLLLFWLGLVLGLVF